MKISAALKQAADDAGLTGTQIASLVGVNESNVSRWLAGHTEPGGKHLIALVDVVPGFGALIGLRRVKAAA